MTKRATIRDVAREAGVSVATVSYVLNNRPNQKISDDTKKKVLQIANLLQYSPSFAAKQLTTGKSNIIGIQIGRYALRNTDHYDLINVLIELLLGSFATRIRAFKQQLSCSHRLLGYDRESLSVLPDLQ